MFWIYKNVFQTIAYVKANDVQNTSRSIKKLNNILRWFSYVCPSSKTPTMTNTLFVVPHSSDGMFVWLSHVRKSDLSQICVLSNWISITSCSEW